MDREFYDPFNRAFPTFRYYDGDPGGDRCFIYGAADHGNGIHSYNRFRTISQYREIAYLKEINQGMEMVAKKNDEIRHYQRIQSLGMMASHIAHEFNNYLTPVLIYSELLENDDTISEENRQMIHEITDSVDKASDLSKKLLAFQDRIQGSG